MSEPQITLMNQMTPILKEENLYRGVGGVCCLNRGLDKISVIWAIWLIRGSDKLGCIKKT